MNNKICLKARNFIPEGKEGCIGNKWVKSAFTNLLNIYDGVKLWKIYGFIHLVRTQNFPKN